MILTVTLNAAIDVTYHVDDLALHGSNRVRAIAQRAGGKGINVARVLQALGHDVLVTGLAGGPTGEQIHADLAASDLRDDLVAISGESRRTVAIVDGTDVTMLNEPGAAVTADEWLHFLARYRKQVVKCAAVVLAGSLPPQLPADAYAVLGEVAGSAGVPVLLDTSGPPLWAGLAGRPDVVKPNEHELTELVPTGRHPVEAAETLRARGARAVVVSRGAQGVVAVTSAGRWHARPPSQVRGNSAGAGDAVVAALAAGIAAGADWRHRLADAVALSAAAVLSPVAGTYDGEAYRRFRPGVTVEELG